MIQQTSIQAYQGLKNLGHRQSQVYLCLKDLQSANNLIISKKLRWGINNVTPRILELRNSGLVVKDCIRLCPITKRMTIFWMIR